MTGPWRPLSWASVGTALGALLLLTGVLVGRPDVAALGAAPLLTGARGWAQRPAAPVELELRAAGQMVAERELSALVAASGAGVRGSALRLRAASPGSRPAEALVRLPAGTERTVELRCAMVRTGPHELFRVDAVALGPDQAVITGPPLTLGPAHVLVLPGTVPLRRAPLPFRLQGMTGAHSSRRPGDGGDLHAVPLFAPGDRRRRSDWRTTARRAGATGQAQLRDLYVRRTYASADATVMLVIDSRDDVGPDVTTWAGGVPVRTTDATSLDLAREAAASLARAYVTAGDRVGLEDLGLRRRPVPPAAGRRHLERIVRRLALSLPEGTPGPRERAPQLPSGSLVVVLSTFLDDEAARMAVLWRRSGHRVVAVDVLPPVRADELGSRLLTAYRLVDIEREDRLALLRRNAVEVVRWSRGGVRSDAEVELAALARTRQRPSGGRR
ncbi:DUF58 domain-containing protein [Georgenia sp. MJ206]|uniref:DUF58 domain-containing protein n=1 Tax=Georgenia wangjunii TaxID=3117730 RepID=UPI002F26AEE8